MTEEQNQLHNLDRQRQAVEMLARETDTPIEIVEEMYVIESTKLDCVARIKTYVPLLASRQVKMRLR